MQDSIPFSGREWKIDSWSKDQAVLVPNDKFWDVECDILITGIPDISPYNVYSILNPLLVQVMALGYLYNLNRGVPLVKKGGVIILCHPAYDEFDPERSELVLGPINKPRWIYSCAKQLMDRVIHAYGQQEGLDYTLFRPFNWIGAGLDSINTAKEGSSRVITQFLGHIVRGETIKLVDGGTQKRTFTYVDDGIAALMKIIANEGGIASGKIYNIGNPKNNYSVRELAQMMLDLALTYAEYRESALRVRLVETTADASAPARSPSWLSASPR